MSKTVLKGLTPVEPDLSGHDPLVPEGLRYRPDFITAGEERALIDGLASLPLAPFQFGAFEGKRRVASYGFRYDFSDQRLHEAQAIPEFIQPFVARAERFAGLETGAVRHVLFTEYATGAGIGWHRDKAAFDIVLGVSLGSACPFRFGRRHGSRWKRHSLEAAPRSIYLLSGEARSVWEHSIAPVTAPRWSITFRTMAA
jgi:alkylated DNA repair dioxygenase AlkB